jgi:hypothetical protein
VRRSSGRSRFAGSERTPNEEFRCQLPRRLGGCSGSTRPLRRSGEEVPWARPRDDRFRLIVLETAAIALATSGSQVWSALPRSQSLTVGGYLRATGWVTCMEVSFKRMLLPAGFCEAATGPSIGGAPRPVLLQMIATRPTPLTLRVTVSIVAGLAVGVLTAIGQRELHGLLEPFVNSVSAWLVVPFLLGALMQTRRGAGAAGLVAAMLELVGFYVTVRLRGFPESSEMILFWTTCGVIGGPLFGIAAHLEWHGRRWWRGVGLGALAGAFFAEGVWTYIEQQHRWGLGGVWVAVALGLVLLIPRGRALRWLCLLLPLSLAGQIAFYGIYVNAVG